MWAVMFVRCCIIIHNLILRIEAGIFDADYREELYQRGRDPRPQDLEDPNNDSDGDGDGDADLRQAQRRLETDGQKFRKTVMKRLFDSTTSGAVRRP